MTPSDPTLANLPALSIRQPWAWLVVHGGKNVENRTWPTRFRGRFLIHAAKGCTEREFDEAVGFVWTNLGSQVTHKIPPFDRLERGGIIGEAELVSCAGCPGSALNSPWFTGPYGFVLRNVRPLPFQPCRGALGFFEPKFEGGAK